MATHSRSVSGSRHVQRGAAALILAAAAGLSCAQEPPIEFKGIVIGMPPPSEGVFTRLSCRAVEGRRNCISLWSLDRPSGTPYETIAGAPIRSMFAVVADGAVDTLRISFHPDHYSDVRDALRAKYTLSCETSEVSNAMGARFDQERCSFAGSNGVLVVTKRAGAVSESAVTMSSPNAATRRNADRKKNASDL